MYLVAVGVEQANAHDQLAMRERLVWQGPRLVHALQLLGQRLDDALILSTCHRTEVYAASQQPDSCVEILRAFFVDAAAVNRHVIDRVLSVWRGHEAVEHLLAVAGGLRSIAIGEHQIQAQLKSAIAAARAARVLGPTTHRLGCAALAVGKRIRTDTSLGRRARSIVSIAVDDVARRVGPLGERSVLVVGAGQVADGVLRRLARHRHPDSLPTAIVNRTASHATQLAVRHLAAVTPWPLLGDALAEAQVAISCTAAPHAVIDRVMVERAAMSRRDSHPLVLVDLARPRDIDPSVRDIAGVTLIDLDHIDDLCRSRRAELGREIARAEAIVAEHTSRFMDWLSVRRVSPTISTLVSRAQGIRQAEVERTLARLPRLSPAEREAIRVMSTRVVGQLLDAPLSVLHADDHRGELARALRRLFLLERPPHTRAYRDESPPTSRHLSSLVESSDQGT